MRRLFTAEFAGDQVGGNDVMVTMSPAVQAEGDDVTPARRFHWLRLKETKWRLGIGQILIMA